MSNDRRTFNCLIPVSMLPACKGSLDSLPPNSNYEVIVDYPLESSVKFKITTGHKGLPSGKLLQKIGKIYERIYQNPDKYKVYGHSLEDLILETVRINHKTKQIALDLGS